MADKSKIEWTDTTWNPITGCTPVSHGCTNCYAAHLAATRLKDNPRYQGLAVLNSHNVGVFNGTIRFHEDKLLAPLKWRKPRRVFVNSMSDLFHEAVPFEFIDRVFAVMALCPQHTFQVLTKRPERMSEYLNGVSLFGGVDGRLWRIEQEIDRYPRTKTSLLRDNSTVEGQIGAFTLKTYPLPNVWLGTSVEDQATADERIPHLLKCPAAVRFLSCEPLLGELDLSRHFNGCIVDVGNGWEFALRDGTIRPNTHWVIVGGESGPNARPMHPNWVRSLRDQCVAAGVPFFFKQWGEWAPGDFTTYERVGKARAGRLLDGCEWDEYPEAR